MINNELLKDISSRISMLMPMAEEIRKDVEQGIHEVLESTFARLNLVTREEFDAQQKVLARAEQTISALEEKIINLEKNLNQ
jgi:BMFP domain-containing protein YqiC